MDAYDDAIRKHKDECRWMAFIDLDEYLFPMQPLKPIHEIVNRLVLKAGKGAAGIGVNWAIFGSSYYTNTPEGLITKNFIRRGENTHWLNYHIKTICNPRLVKKYISPHYPLYKLGAYSISESEGKRIYGWFCWSVRYSYIRINHYFTKSKEQFLAKRNRGLADRLGQYELEKFNQKKIKEIQDKYKNTEKKKVKESNEFDKLRKKTEQYQKAILLKNKFENKEISEDEISDEYKEVIRKIYNEKINILKHRIKK